MTTELFITGVPQASSRLISVGRAARDQTHVFKAQARRTQRRISGIPTATGRLERGVTGGSAEARIEAGPWGFAIITDVLYSRWVFGGTVHMRARPPRIPADVGPETARAVSADINRVR